MTINNQVLYDNFTFDRKKVYSEINRVNTQISSGKKIQHSYEDGAIFTKSLRLDSEVKNLEEIKDRTTEAKAYADSADSVMSEFDLTLRDFKTQLINAANQTLNQDNYEAIAAELENSKEHMMNLANTTLNGIYLFSGTDTSVAPIDNKGNYHGNDKPLSTVISKNVKLPYSIDGQTLFLGETSEHKTISTNVKLINQNTDETIKTTDKVDDLIKDSSGSQINIFISGTKSDGTSFKDKFAFDSNNTMDDLLVKIGKEFGNTTDTKLVDVSLDKNGNIVVEDLQKGKSALSLNIVGFQGGNSDTETDLTQVQYDKVIKFTTSKFDSPLGVDEDRQMNTFYFDKKGSTLRGNDPILVDHEFATNNTLLKDIANGSLDGATYKMNLTNVNGDDKEVTLNLNNNSTFTIDGNTYNIYNADGSQTKADEMTQGQLNNIISMVISNELPQSNDKSGFDDAVVKAREKVTVDIDSGGKLQIQDKTVDGESKIKFAIYDNNANNFDPAVKDKPSINFMSNNLVTTQKAEMDFFKDLDEIIQSVREGKINVNSDSDNPRNLGIQDALNVLDKMGSHFNTQQSKLGSLSKTLESENQKAFTLQTNVKELQSEVEDIDLADAVVKLDQLTLNYQAMLSTVSKVNSLSLLNYLK